LTQHARHQELEPVGVCERLVFIVDDDEMHRSAMADLLAEAGYCTLTAENGAQALAKLRQSPRPRPCLILLDLMMPVMNGQQFHAQKQSDPDLSWIPLVVMSADADLAEKAGALGSGFLAKPAGRAIVLATVARHCPGGATSTAARAS
jgi:CheY-like chemotaxis protein